MALRIVVGYLDRQHLTDSTKISASPAPDILEQNRTSKSVLPLVGDVSHDARSRDRLPARATLSHPAQLVGRELVAKYPFHFGRVGAELALHFL
jgi:hypothetical protein